MTKLTVRPSSRPRGLVLILTAFFVFMLFVLALSLFQLVPVEFHSALRTRQAIAGQVVAESGFKDAVTWLKMQSANIDLPQARLDANYNNGGRVNLGDGWAYEAHIIARASSLGIYDIVSEAFFDGAPVRETRATVTRGSFAQYALFIDNWDPNHVFTMAPNSLQGPFHTNGFFRLGVPGSFAGLYDFEQPFVSGNYAYMSHAGLSQTGNGMEYNDGNEYYHQPGASAVLVDNPDILPYNNSGPIVSRMRSIVEGGSGNLQKTDRISLPSSAADLQLRAMDGGPGAPPFAFPADIEVGFAVAANDGQVTGGILVAGDVGVTLALSPEGNQIHHLSQNIPERAFRYEYADQEPIIDYVSEQRPAGEWVDVYELRDVPVTRQVIDHYIDATVTKYRAEQRGTQLVNGISTPIIEMVPYQVTERRPVYKDETVTEQQYVPTGRRQLEQAETVTVRRQVGTRDVTRYAIIYPDQYNANPGAYPGAIEISLNPVSKAGQVIEVTAENGFQGLGVSAPQGSTVVQDYDGNVTVLQGNLNGVTFVNGNVTSLKGVSKGGIGSSGDPNDFQGRYLVANPVGGHGITITGDLLNFYDGNNPELRDPASSKTLRRGKLSPNGEHGLGLVANTVQLKPSDLSAAAPAVLSNDDDESRYLDIYAAILAGHSLANGDVSGGFGAHPSLIDPRRGDFAGHLPLRAFRLFGGLVEANADPWNSGGKGFAGMLTYDPAVAQALPMFPRVKEVVRTLRYTDRYVDSH